MNIIEKFLVFLDTSMIEPNSYGWFHLMFIGLLFLSSFLIIYKYKNNEKKGEKIILVLSILCLILEVYKQINFSFNYEGNLTWWEYQWYAFPFQFCSTPMYCGFIAYFTKSKKLKESLYYFLATYGLIGGLITMIYPESCFINTIGINIQTMVHHSSQILMGLSVVFCMKKIFNFNSFLQATKVFIVQVLIALTINIVTYYAGINGGLEMFYISPFHNCSLPILSSINENVPYILFLIIYILLFSLGCFGLTYLYKIIRRREK